MRSQVMLVTTSGQKFILAGYASRVQQQVNEGRGKSELIPFERDVTPTGQMVYIDPDNVESVRDV